MSKLELRAIMSHFGGYQFYLPFGCRIIICYQAHFLKEGFVLVGIVGEKILLKEVRGQSKQAIRQTHTKELRSTT